jgi:diaminohydroxyphosphoribosylaminopyrimidine deaminase/5-amino-6-(5-phosphoribosylamino)uracil reductase
LRALMHELALDGVNELHVEAGARLNGALLDAGLVDEVVCYLAPSLIGDPARGMFQRAAPLDDLAAHTPLAIVDVARLGADLRIVARVTREAR